MKRIGLLWLFILVLSCDNFNKKIEANELLEEELKTFDWNDVDTFPAFETCESATSKQESKQCFESTLTQHILAYLSEMPLVSSEELHDTIKVAFRISEEGQLTINEVRANQLVRDLFPDLDAMIRNSLKELPKTYPALKRGQKVKTQFELPIVVTTN